ncbi:trafficking protein particle complex subunit 20 [Trichomonascus vanleenenianus]|uniref:TRAPP subunit TRS20 n=1 Tax=Trichomonascus vanleenenianus TaxID=2268995 RepID=UPI003ECADFDB
MSYYLAIIGTKDCPIYELEFGTNRQGGDGVARFSPEMKELNPFILHAALDVVEYVQWTTNSLYLKAVDNFYSYMISAFVTAGNIKFLLLHETRNEDGIRQFFSDVYDLYVKTLLSPFYFTNQPIQSPIFDQKVRQLAKRYL